MGGIEAARATIAESLREVLVNYLRNVPDDVDWDTVTLSELGLDSMSAIDLVIDIEDTFGMEFPADLLVRETFASFTALESAIRETVLES